MKILILEANPYDDLSLDKEILELRIVIDESSESNKFQVKYGRAIRKDQLHKLMLELEEKAPKDDPIIVHFCGHGTGEQGLVFENEKGEKDLVSTQVLADFFALFKNRVACVVMNACYADVQAEAINKHIKYVIGMKQSIRDDAAIAFSIGFYRALGFGRSFEDAFKFGKNAIQLTIDDSSKSRNAITKEIDRKLIPVGEVPETNITQEYLKPNIDDFTQDNLLTRLDSYLGLQNFVNKYVTEILNIKDLSDNQKQKLEQWIKSNFSDIVFPTKNTPQSILESYLLIIIYRKVQTKNNRQKRFDIRAEFIEKFPQTPNIEVKLNQKDIKEKGYLEQEIPNIIYKFIEKVIEKVNDANQLKIEFFLPIDCLTKEFEFKIPEIWKRERRRLCEKFWLILRPFERHYYHCNLSKANDKVLQKISYDTFKEKLQQIKTINEEHIVVCNQKDNLEKKQLKEKLDRAIIIQISCGLPTRSIKKNELFQIIFEHGIPICLWFKKEKLDFEFSSLLKLLKSEDTNK